jgi:UDP-N-acetylmuramate dehydrogenase
VLPYLQKNVPLSSYSTFGIGGEASFFLPCKTIDDLAGGMSWAEENGIISLVIGHGSNCLFPDQGFPGLILHNELVSFEDQGSGFFVVEAGYSFSLLGVQTCREGWSGLEFAAGIPGSVGGAIFMNAGAHGQETSLPLRFVEVLEHGKVQRIPRQEIRFGYRFSSFQEKKGIIVRAGFQLQKDDASYSRQLQMLEQRKKTQPYRESSAGCVFRNPPGCSAGKLIEEVGLKGTRIGGAEISPMHANFIVNSGGATSAQVKQLIDLVQSTVLEKRNVRLQCEVRLI